MFGEFKSNKRPAYYLHCCPNGIEHTESIYASEDARNAIYQ
ncbi:hypothetical protein BSLA_02r0645 [Burkholderia stabilis]|nr:hypothetical protein BSLA_02r0645 [Burkholderia stabilis]